MNPPLRAAPLEDSLPGLVYGFTGALPPHGAGRFTAALRAEIPAVWAPSAPLYVLKQVHSPDVVTFPAREGQENAGGRDGTPEAEVEPPRADGAVLTHGSGAVAIQTADCVPVLAVNVPRGAVAALHAGWRGAAAGILPNLLERWSARDAAPGAIRLAFGPSIHACCYAVREDCTGAFDPVHLEGAVTERSGRLYLELTRVLANQARTYGVPAEAIAALPHCTACFGEPSRRPFASFRRDGRPGEPYLGRNASFIGFSRR